MLKRRNVAVAELSHQLRVTQQKNNELLHELFLLKNGKAVHPPLFHSDEPPVYNIGIHKKYKAHMADVSGNFYVIDASGIPHVVYSAYPNPPTLPIGGDTKAELKNEMVYSKEGGGGRGFYWNGHPHFYYNPYSDFYNPHSNPYYNPYSAPYYNPYLHDDPYDTD